MKIVISSTGSVKRIPDKFVATIDMLYSFGTEKEARETAPRYVSEVCTVLSNNDVAFRRLGTPVIEPRMKRVEIKSADESRTETSWVEDGYTYRQRGEIRIEAWDEAAINNMLHDIFSMENAPAVFGRYELTDKQISEMNESALARSFDNAIADATVIFESANCKSVGKDVELVLREAVLERKEGYYSAMCADTAKGFGATAESNLYTVRKPLEVSRTVQFTFESVEKK